MATSGSTSVAVTAYDTLKFSWSIGSQSIANNTTTVTWKLELIAGANGAISSTASKSWSVVVNGTTYSGTNTVGIGNNATKTLASGSTVIAHNSDGTKSFSYSFSQYFGITFSGASVGTKSGSGSGTLTTIPRKSTMTVSNGTLGTEQTLTVNKKATSFTHTIKYKSGNYSGTIAEKSTATSVKWTPPLELANGAPNGTSVYISLTIETFNGSTSIGTNTYPISCGIPASIKPSVSFTVADAMGYLSKYGAYVRGKSKFKIDVTASGSYGSRIASYKVVADGKTYAKANVETDVIAGSGTLTITVTVTDSRGRTATANKSVTVSDYEAPKITALSLKRTNSAGNSSSSGAYLTATFSANISSISSKNTAVYKLQYKKKNDSSYTTVTLTAYANNFAVTNGKYTFSADPSSSYDVILTATDDFSSATKSGTGPSTTKVFSILSKGLGLAIGKVAEIPNAFEIAFDIYDKHRTQIRNGLAFYESNGATDADTTIEELFLSSNNTPDGGLWNVRQIFYGAKTAESNRTQHAIPYAYGSNFANSNKSNFRRHYVNATGWSEWIEEPVIVEQGTSGIWQYVKYSDGSVECWGKYSVSNLACTTALGNMFRTDVFQPNSFPFTISNPHVFADYESAGYGAFLWATSNASTTAPPSYYLVRPTSSSGVTGTVKFHVKGKWK